jgi:hypothetical protein
MPSASVAFTAHETGEPAVTVLLFAGLVKVTEGGGLVVLPPPVAVPLLLIVIERVALAVAPLLLDATARSVYEPSA